MELTSFSALIQSGHFSYFYCHIKNTLMKNLALFTLLIAVSISASAQQALTPEKLWELGRVSAIGLTEDKEELVYRVSKPSISENEISTEYYKVALTGGHPEKIDNAEGLVPNKKISPDGKFELY